MRQTYLIQITCVFYRKFWLSINIIFKNEWNQLLFLWLICAIEIGRIPLTYFRFGLRLWHNLIYINNPCIFLLRIPTLYTHHVTNWTVWIRLILIKLIWDFGFCRKFLKYYWYRLRLWNKLNIQFSCIIV